MEWELATGRLNAYDKPWVCTVLDSRTGRECLEVAAFADDSGHGPSGVCAKHARLMSELPTTPEGWSRWLPKEPLPNTGPKVFRVGQIWAASWSRSAVIYRVTSVNGEWTYGTVLASRETAEAGADDFAVLRAGIGIVSVLLFDAPEEAEAEKPCDPWCGKIFMDDDVPTATHHPSMTVSGHLNWDICPGSIVNCEHRAYCNNSPACAGRAKGSVAPKLVETPIVAEHADGTVTHGTSYRRAEPDPKCRGCGAPGPLGHSGICFACHVTADTQLGERMVAAGYRTLTPETPPTPAHEHPWYGGEIDPDWVPGSPR